MKIGYLLQQQEDLFTPPFGGPANHARHIVSALQELGHEARILANHHGQIVAADTLSDYRPVTVSWLDRGPARWLEKGARRLQYELQLPYAALFESLRFASACRQELNDCDLFLERMSWVSYGGALASRWLNIPLVLENNGDHLADLEAKGIAPRGWQRRISFWGMGWAVKQAAHVVVSGEGWRDQFLARWPVEPARVTTVENGTILLRLLPRERLRAFREEGASKTPVTLVYLGGFTPWQGVPVLLRALAQARAVNENLCLLLIGDGEGRAGAEQLAAELGIAGAAIFTGRLEAKDYAPLLAQADVGVAPYCDWPEFSGLKIFDYKAAALPVIASGQNGRPASVQRQQSGWIVPPGDQEALCQAILTLAANAPLRRRLGRTARLQAEDNHDWLHTAGRLEEIFQTLV